MADWSANLLESSDDIRALLRDTKTVAVLGIKTEEQSDQAAFYVPEYLDGVGLEVIPVPVYYPEVKTILGKPVHRTLASIPGLVDMVNVFRRPADVAKHLDDLLAKKPKSVWMQSGIRNEAVAEALAKAGILVVQDRCLMVEHRRLR